MGFDLGSMLGGLFAAGGQVASDVININYQKEANAKNEALMRESWARDDSAVTRRVADLKNAGLNPVLAAGGSGAPNSGPISVNAPQVKGLNMGQIAQGVMLKKQQDIAQNDVNIGRAKADEAKESAVVAHAEAQIAKARQNWAQTIAEQEVNQRRLDIENSSTQSEILDRQKRLLDKDLEFYDTNRYMNYATQGLGAIANAIGGGLSGAVKASNLVSHAVNKR